MAKVHFSTSASLPRFDHRIKNLVGCRFGRLTVNNFAGRNKRQLIQWSCTCDCGTTDIIATSTTLTGGHKLSCGCLGREVTSKRSRTHGQKHSPEYQTWRSMKHRCYCVTAPGYTNYGGRGIIVCERWRNSFENFLADMGRRPQPASDYELDRINNDGNYEPGNCRWATRKQQANNRRQGRRGICRASHVVVFEGQRMILADLARRFGIDYHLLHSRLSAGWNLQKSLLNCITPRPPVARDRRA